MIKEQVISAFKEEFHFVRDKFQIMDLLENGSPMDYAVINELKLPSDEYNIVWHPGVYIFLGNNSVYRVGKSNVNSRHRVMQHLLKRTSLNGYCIWDIDKFDDKSILLFNIKNKIDDHWLLALELYLESKFKPLIPALKRG